MGQSLFLELLAPVLLAEKLAILGHVTVKGNLLKKWAREALEPEGQA